MQQANAFTGHDQPCKLRTLVIGLGNPLLRDDGAGIYAVRRLRLALESMTWITLAELSVGGITLMEHMVGYQRVILIDTLWTPPEQAGQVIVFDAGDLSETLNTRSTHDVDLPTALRVGRSLGAQLPTDTAIRIIAITANKVLDFGEKPSPVVAAAIPAACDCVLQLLQANLVASDQA